MARTQLLFNSFPVLFNYMIKVLLTLKPQFLVSLSLSREREARLQSLLLYKVHSQL